MPKVRVMQLSKKLRELMKLNDLTVARLSKYTAVPVNTLHNWLSGQAPRTVSQLKAVAEFFGVTVDYLVFGTEVRVDSNALPELLHSGQFEIVVRPRGLRREI